MAQVNKNIFYRAINWAQLLARIVQLFYTTASVNGTDNGTRSSLREKLNFLPFETEKVCENKM